MSRDRILGRVREALEARPGVEHPGAFQGWRQAAEEQKTPPDSLTTFLEMFRSAGGKVVRAVGREEARERIRALTEGRAGISAGAGVPDDLLPDLPRMDPRDAPVGVSMARGAVAETGSLLMDARDGRRAQLLPPVHLVLVGEDMIHRTLAEALAAVVDDLPSGLGLHSGPSKSADIGQVLVEGVHGPGRLVAVVVAGEEPGPAPEG